MVYNLNAVTTVEDCTVLLEAADIEKGELTFRKIQQERLYKNVTAGGLGVEAELAAVEAEITSLVTVLANLPGGAVKDEFESRLIKVRYKKFLLEERRERYGIIAMVQKEYAINCIDKELVETDAYIAAVNVRKDEI